ncbi:MAG: 23S rRNA (pseudouridine(1915)-N(3))-methyltransferase RlmH [Rhizobiaceae bacterium]|nr:23S rRNA (pseudouridine(1915)-N(3))-methyltransferase RlmH [Rhizobiaceae bacterium]
MRVEVHAVGRLKAGPERELAQRYFDRLAKAGPAVGLEFAGVTEIVESRVADAAGRKREEAQRLRERLGQGQALILLDERGRSLSSEDFSARIAAMRDAGRKGLVLAIGGPDGHDPALASEADLLLSFGALTWPHQLVRVMLAEQLYRAATILAGHPYHRS